MTSFLAHAQCLALKRRRYYSVLCAAATTRLSETENLNVSGSKFGRCVPILGMASAVLLYGRQPRKSRDNFFQELCALEMWKCGADQKLFQCFQRLGICKGTAGAKGAVDRLRREFDSEIVQWKHDIEEMEKTRTLNETFESEQPMTYDSPDIWTLVPPNEIRTVEPSIDHEDMKMINFPSSSSVADENTKSDQDMSLNYIPSMDVSPAERINIFTQHENDHHGTYYRQTLDDILTALYDYQCRDDQLCGLVNCTNIGCHRSY